MPLIVAKGDRPAAELVEAFERVDEVAEERIAPHLAVGDDVEAGRFLQRDGFVDGAVLDAFERCSGELAPRNGIARLQEIRRSEQTANDVAAGRRHGDT